MSIAGLMGLVALSAIGLIALRHPSDLSASLLYSLTLGLNLAAVVAAIASEGQVRSVAAGFAIFGWGHLISAHLSWISASKFPSLITMKMIERIVARMDLQPTDFNYLAFFWVAISLLTIAAGFAGGLFAWSLSRRPIAFARSINSNTGQP